VQAANRTIRTTDARRIHRKGDVQSWGWPNVGFGVDRGMMIIALYIAAGAIMAVGTLYLAWRSRDFRKFLAGAFFVASGTLFYLYLADVSVPLLGTNFVETSQISGVRSIIHFILFLVCFYFGFARKPRA
jgi:hypothetical protein